MAVAAIMLDVPDNSGVLECSANSGRSSMVVMPDRAKLFLVRTMDHTFAKEAQRTSRTCGPNAIKQYYSPLYACLELLWSLYAAQG